MKSTTSTFKENVHSELQNEKLKQVFGGILLVLPLGRAMAKANLPEFDALRDQARDIKNHTLENLDFYLEAFEAKVLEQGGQVHWCETHEEARDVVLKICQDVGAKTVTKGKSMITEEMGLNDYLETHGIQPIETDMGEYIIQLAGETPSHLIGPAFHKTKEDVTELFYEHHKTQR
ncbi:MAG: lactate utilization protein, partial [Alphaproteobacteria bacterium]